MKKKDLETPLMVVGYFTMFAGAIMVRSGCGLIGAAIVFVVGVVLMIGSFHV